MISPPQNARRPSPQMVLLLTSSSSSFSDVMKTGNRGWTKGAMACPMARSICRRNVLRENILRSLWLQLFQCALWLFKGKSAKSKLMEGRTRCAAAKQHLSFSAFRGTSILFLLKISLLNLFTPSGGQSKNSQQIPNFLLNNPNNKQHHAIVLLKSFHLNGHTIGIHRQTQKLELHIK